MKSKKIRKKKRFLRDTLAIERTELANERTFYAGIRTSLTLFVVGITLLKLVDIAWIHTCAWFFIIGSGIAFIIDLVRFFSIEKNLKKNE